VSFVTNFSHLSHALWFILTNTQVSFTSPKTPLSNFLENEIINSAGLNPIGKISSLVHAVGSLKETVEEL
jgi:hypothetical protein